MTDQPQPHHHTAPEATSPCASEPPSLVNWYRHADQQQIDADLEADRWARPERQARHCHAELNRAYRLLAAALQVASRDGQDCDPLQLLEAIAQLTGDRLNQPAIIREQQDQRRRYWTHERVLRLLEETNPRKLGKRAA